MAVQRAVRSWLKKPSQEPMVPVPTSRPARLTGGTTHWKLVPLPQLFAWRPPVPKKKRPSFAPSTAAAVSVKPEAAVALAEPGAASRVVVVAGQHHR